MPTLATAPPAATLPHPRGPLSLAVLEVLAGRRYSSDLSTHRGEAASSEPFGDDLQLALYACYELHYRSFSGVHDDLEWDPDLLAFRAAMERPFLAALRAGVAGGDDVDAALEPLLVEDAGGEGPSYHLAERGQRWQLREYLAHRSIYHLKEADPQAWVIPRLDGQAKASMVTVEHDEYGAGRAERLHATLFAEMMVALDLDPSYGHYLDVVPAATLATVNAMSYFGLHRAMRGALIGQFASVEISSSPGSARLARAVRQLAGDRPGATRFYTEHIEADAVHEQVVRGGIIADLLRRNPELAPDVVFGIQADGLLETSLAEHLMAAWRAGSTSLLQPLP